MEHLQDGRAAVDRRPASSRLKFVLFGALTPVVLFALPVATMTVVGTPVSDPAVVADAGSAPNCESPRNVWRPACQTLRETAARDPETTGSVGGDSATTAALDAKAKRRSVPGSAAVAQLDQPAAKPWTERPEQTASAPNDAPQAQPEPTRAEPSPASKPAPAAWQDPPRAADLPEAAKTPAAAQRTPDRTEPAIQVQDPAAKPEPVQAAAFPPDDETRVIEDSKPAVADSNVPVPQAAPAEPAPTRAAKAAPTREAAKLVAKADQAQRLARREARRAAREGARETARQAAREAARKAAAREQRAQARVAARALERPVRLARHRMRAVEPDEVEEAAPRSIAPRWSERRLAARRAAVSDGLRVTSVQTYMLPDGRRVMVNVQPRPSVVRELAAHHAATFHHRRAAAAAPGWGMGWGPEAYGW